MRPAITKCVILFLMSSSFPVLSEANTLNGVWFSRDENSQETYSPMAFIFHDKCGGIIHYRYAPEKIAEFSFSPGSVTDHDIYYEIEISGLNNGAGKMRILASAWKRGNKDNEKGILSGASFLYLKDQGGIYNSFFLDLYLVSENTYNSYSSVFINKALDFFREEFPNCQYSTK